MYLLLCLQQLFQSYFYVESSIDEWVGYCATALGHTPALLTGERCWIGLCGGGWMSRVRLWKAQRCIVFYSTNKVSEFRDRCWLSFLSFSLLLVFGRATKETRENVHIGLVLWANWKSCAVQYSRLLPICIWHWKKFREWYYSKTGVGNCACFMFQSGKYS